MFSLNFVSGKNLEALMAALHRSLAIIEFEPSGRIITANENFCQAIGYDRSEITGQHHSMFVAPDHARSPEYKEFWDKLRRGEFDSGEYKRIAKGGRDIWIQASYNPIRSANGAVLKVVKVATDITLEKLKNAEFEAKINAISRVQAVIEFTPDGHILAANENFLSVVGYRLEEIRGKHHRMFVESSYGQSSNYQEFWRKLNAGQFVSAEFMRIGKGGKEIWIQASYNPIFDLNGKVIKITKFATDITDRVLAVKEVGSGLTQLAANNLLYRVETAFTPQFEKLRTDLNESMEKLCSSMVRIASSTDAIQAGAHEISAAADDLSRRTEHQAANLQETADALNHMTSAVKTSAEGAAHAREVVATANNDAKQSAIVVGQTVDAMDAIAKSAQQISQIIGVIDEIAFQTNLLALNAGVEAARAGDAGRGFAVVASEVRALAQRSAEAAKEIKGLISASTAQVDHGVRLVAETGQSLGRIMKQVNDINGIVTEIAGGAKEQATGLAEINAAIKQMDQVTQQNVAMVEETTAASHSLSSEAVKLAELIGQFKVSVSNFDSGHDRRNASRAPRPVATRAAPVRQLRPTPKLAANGGPVVEAGGWDAF